jgi:plasmid stability protein
MPVMIQLRNVPDDLHRKLKARAAEEGLSLSDYILRDAKRLAEQPTREELMRRLSKLRPLRLTQTPEQTIRAARDGR